MWHVRRWVGATGMAAALVLGTGCGEKLSSEDQSTAESKVTGTVTVHGKAMSEGEVVFAPLNPKRKGAGPKSASIKKDGRYEVTTLVGQNVVRIKGPLLKKEPTLGYASKTVDVKSGDNTIDLEF